MRIVCCAALLFSCAGPGSNNTNNTTSGGDITGTVLLSNNYGLQFHPLFRSDFGAGSALGRVKLFARFCNDAACAEPTALVAAEVEDPDSNGRYLFSTASTSGAGFEKAFKVKAPSGAAYMQLIGDTQLSNERGVGACTSISDCPGDLDVLQMDGFSTSANSDGTVAQAAAATTALAGKTDVGLIYLGHFHFDMGAMRTKAPADTGTLLVALSNTADTFRNRIAKVDLDDASAHPGAIESAYTLQNGAGDLQGDICGMVKGGSSLYALGYSNAGGHVFRLNATTGAQESTAPVVTIPPAGGAQGFPHPCRGVYASVGGKEHLYLIEFSGAGSLATSLPHAIYDVNLTDGTFATPAVDTNMAIRAITYVADGGTGSVIALDMSWSQFAINSGMKKQRLLKFAVGADGALGAFTTTLTTLAGDDKCDSTLQWPTGVATISLGGVTRLLVGHDTGVAVFDPAALATAPTNLELPAFGRLFSQFSAQGSKLYALPQCKALTTNSPFQLPMGAGMEGSDSYRAAILDLSGATLAIASTDIDVNGDGTKEHGIDLDFYPLKQFIRAHGTTLPIPPVVYTGPQMAVGNKMLFVRGTGIQGNGSTALSSSGMGQAQEVSFFDLASGRGVLFGGYVPWTHGLSADAGRSKAIWGYDLVPGKEGSIGWIEYLP